MKTIAIAISALLVTGLGCKTKPVEGADSSNTTQNAKSGPAPGDIPAPPDVAATPADAQKTASGLASKLLKPGSGVDKPRKWDSVEVHYTGWTTDGKMFDSSVKRGRAARFGLKNVIPGWTEGLQLMVVGEKRRFWIPVELAYNNRPGKPAGMLVFDVELLNIHKGKEPIPAPPDVAAAPADAKKTASGLAYKILSSKGSKKSPEAWHRVEVHYTGWKTDGEMFDSSVQRGRTATFGLNGVIKGWTEGVQLMAEGDKARFWIPGNLAYGDTPKRPGAPAGTLVFDIELVKVVETPKPPEPPKDVATTPPNATKTASGLTYVVLKKGTGKVKPKPTDRVEVHYSGWTTDGKMFDSSVTRGKPAVFGVGQVIRGWTEGLQLMVEGEKTRFWIPAEMAYGNSPRGGRPAGMLVFDVELLRINPS